MSEKLGRKGFLLEEIGVYGGEETEKCLRESKENNETTSRGNESTVDHTVLEESREGE